MTTVTFAQRLHPSNFMGSGQRLADLCIVEVTPQAAEAVCALADVWRITVPEPAAGVLPSGIVVRDPDERLGRVRLIRSSTTPALLDALQSAGNPYAIIGLTDVFLTPETPYWKIEDAEITIVDNGTDTLIRWAGLVEGEEYNITVEFIVSMFAQILANR